MSVTLRFRRVGYQLARPLQATLHSQVSEYSNFEWHSKTVALSCDISSKKCACWFMILCACLCFELFVTVWKSSLDIFGHALNH